MAWPLLTRLTTECVRQPVVREGVSVAIVGSSKIVGR